MSPFLVESPLDGGSQPRGPIEAARTPSEQLFEEYLALRGLAFEFEPTIFGASKKPDYRITSPPQSALVEVKEFVGDGSVTVGGFAAFDPYPPIREKINAASRKFRQLKDHACALLLYNVSGHLIRIDQPRIVMAAMLGDFGFQFRVDTRSGAAVEDPQPAFLGRGKMRNYQRNRPQNTTIAAILVLEAFPLGVKEFPLKEANLAAEKKRILTACELVALAQESGETVLRIKYHANPYARHQFPSEFFTGPFDEHWTWSPEGNLERSFVGPELADLERRLDKKRVP